MNREVDVLDTNRIDLSLQGIQNKIATTIANLLQMEYIREIDVTNLTCPADATARQVCGCMEMEKNFPDGSTFKMKCKIDVDTVPAVHYLGIDIEYSENYGIHLKCNPNPQNAFYIGKILAKAMNYKNYHNVDEIYNRSHILENFAQKMYVISVKKVYIFQRLKAKLLELEKNIKANTFSASEFTFEFDKMRFVICNHNIGVFEFKCENRESGRKIYCYFPRNIIGLDSLILSINRVINLLRMDALDDEEL